MINNDLYCENGKKWYLNQRLTKKDTTSREHEYYLNIESQENSDIEFRYCKGRLHGEVIDKLGYLEDILEKIPYNQLMALIKTKEKLHGGR